MEVIIEIKNTDEKGQQLKFDKEIKEGKPYTSITYSGRTYGGAHPCINKHEIQQAIENAKQTIKAHGQIPKINDKRQETKLTQWIQTKEVKK